MKAMANIQHAPTAAAKAGYKNPQQMASRLMKRPEVAEATREEARRVLHEKGGAVGVYVAMEIALDTAQPGGTRIKAAGLLISSSGIGVSEEAAGKDLHEMNGPELAAYLAQLEAQSAALKRTIADRAKPVIDHAEDAESTPFD